MMNERQLAFNSSFIIPHSSLLLLLRFPLPDLLAVTVAVGLGDFAEGYLHEREDGVVRLMFALELVHVVVRAARALRVLAAHVGPRVVDGAAALVLVEEDARDGEDLVLNLPEHAL